MNIALVSPSTLPFCSGNSILAERMRAELSRRGHTVSLFNSRTDDEAAAVSLQPDIVHSLHAVKPSAWLEKLFCRYSAPWVITFTGTDYDTGLKHQAAKDLLHRSLRQASALVVFHDEAGKTLSGLFPGFEARTHVIPQSVAPCSHALSRQDMRSTCGIQADAVVVLMTAGIRKIKNIGCALDAFSAVKKRCSRALFVLAGPVIEDDEGALVLQQGESVPGFMYLGALPYREVRNLMAVSDVFLNTSLHEGMSGAVLEAMAEGLPVAAADISGNRAVVEDGKNGFLVPLQDREKLIGALELLVRDGALRASLGARGRQMAARFGVQEEIDAYERLYEGIVSHAETDAALG